MGGPEPRRQSDGQGSSMQGGSVNVFDTQTASSQYVPAGQSASCMHSGGQFAGRDDTGVPVLFSAHNWPFMQNSSDSQQSLPQMLGSAQLRSGA